MKTFENKTVLITGGNSGIGKATVLAFAKEGANVVISGRRVAEGEKLAKEITSAGGSALFVRTDVAREDDIVALVEKTVDTFGALHIAFRHPQLFGAVGAHSAALIERLPNISAQNSRQMSQLRVLGDAFGSPFDPAFWNRNDPLTIARTANLSGLKIYFDCGSEDDYGFDSGAEALDKLLTSRHIPHEFHLYPGGHNWSYFAEHLPALLEFEFHAFESAPTHATPASLI